MRRTVVCALTVLAALGTVVPAHGATTIASGTITAAPATLGSVLGPEGAAYIANGCKDTEPNTGHDFHSGVFGAYVNIAGYAGRTLVLTVTGAEYGINASSAQVLANSSPSCSPGFLNNGVPAPTAAYGAPKSFVATGTFIQLALGSGSITNANVHYTLQVL